VKKQIASGVLAILASAPALANPAHDILSGMGESKRSQAFAKTIAASGERCASVDRTFYQGSAKNGDAFWNASCSGGKAFAIQVSNNSRGSTQILDCKMMKAVNAGMCFKKFPQ
jgi:hypothetical protein